MGLERMKGVSGEIICLLKFSRVSISIHPTCWAESRLRDGGPIGFNPILANRQSVGQAVQRLAPVI